MGDFRGECAVELTIRNKTYRYTSGWVNWSENRNREIAVWLQECWDDAQARWDSEVMGPVRREQEERAERQELARLRAKYG